MWYVVCGRILEQVLRVSLTGVCSGERPSYLFLVQPLEWACSDRSLSRIFLLLCLKKLGFLIWLFLLQKGVTGARIYNSAMLFRTGSWSVLFLSIFTPICQGVTEMIP